MANESYPELRDGDNGDWVVYLQQLLEYAGYGPLAANGDFDGATTTALSSFQVAHGVNSPGVANQVTWEALVAIGGSPQGQPTPAPFGGAPMHGTETGTDPLAQKMMGPLGNLVLFGPSPLMFFSIIGLIGGLAERQERREKEAAELENLRSTGDLYRRWTLAKAAANIIQDVLVSSDADGLLYTTNEAGRIHTAEAALVALLHENDWVAGSSDIGVVEGWLGNIPEDAWNHISGRVTGLWNEMVEALKSGTPRSTEGPDMTRGAINVSPDDVHQLFFSQVNHAEYYVKGR
jgi:peptidoglycan hydrolase-like protein with peptidoglycan-binding domain